MRMTTMSEQAIAQTIGSRVEALRVKKNINQETVAEEAGISRTTLRQLMAGKGTLLNLIAVLRVIGELDRLSSLVEEVRSSPIQMAKMAGKKRQRAYTTRKDSSETTSIPGQKKRLVPDAVKKDTRW
ncbi:helix-turn-helix domain-containing protein [Pseudomonas lactis]|nr:MULTISPECIES: helix-turn-helix transcriptional regulator [Pseudomonas]MBD8559499.1 helix-turn-helix transcriptional regulator [Pseudomonas fluorescens]MBR7211227.1 XRE family transcriptional regulator [Pseudomonas sp. B2021]MCF5370793.1 helix-turn-helix domain-containing protein [Pseudomonas sp. PA-4-8C]KRP79358.1 DNA-binding protein [Pseudomonas lactis]MBI6975351.1 helix-turn-helix transcriptional regulator [Pseudomonas lactis]